MSAASKPGSGEASVTDALRTATLGPLVAVSRAVNQAIGAQSAMREATDSVVAMRAAVAVVLACEGLQAAAKDAEAQARRALAEAMAYGATSIQTEFHTVSLKRGARRVLVTDPALLPARFMVQPPQPPPAPDLSAIALTLREGNAVSGAELTNGGPDTIQITKRKIAP